MGKHVWKLYGVTLVGMLAMLIPFILIGILLALIQIALFHDNTIDLFNSEMISNFLGEYLLYFLIQTLLTSFLLAFFLGGIYGTANDAITKGHVSVGSFFQNGGRYYGKMLGYSIISSLIFFIYELISLYLYYLAEVTGMIENHTSLLIDLLLFVAYIFLMPVLILPPILIINDRISVFRSFLLPYKTFGKSLLTTILTFLVFLGITLLFFLPLIVIAIAMGFGMEEILHIDIFNTSGPASEFAAISIFLLFILLILVYFFVGVPFTVSFGVLFAVNRYHKRIRPVLFGDAPTTQSRIPGEVPPSPPTSPTQQPIQPSVLEQPKFTFQLPDSDPNETKQEDTDEDTGRFTF